MVFIFALIGMFCWGITPIFLKIGLHNINPLVGLALRTMFTTGLLIGWMIISGTISQLKGIPFTSWFLIGLEAIIATLIGDLAYFAAIKWGEVSLVTIIMSSSPLVTILCSILFLGERITLERIAGAGLILIGIILIM